MDDLWMKNDVIELIQLTLIWHDQEFKMIGTAVKQLWMKHD